MSLYSLASFLSTSSLSASACKWREGGERSSFIVPPSFSFPSKLSSIHLLTLLSNPHTFHLLLLLLPPFCRREPPSTYPSSLPPSHFPPPPPPPSILPSGASIYLSFSPTLPLSSSSFPPPTPRPFSLPSLPLSPFCLREVFAAWLVSHLSELSLRLQEVVGG